MTTESPLDFTSDFPPVPLADALAEWRQMVERDLKGAPFDKKLVTRLIEGISMPPLVTAADWPADAENIGLPGGAPFVRGTKILGNVRDGWIIRQDIRHPDRDTARQIIADERANGVGEIALIVDAAGSAGFDADAFAIDDPANLAGVDGVMISTADDFGFLLGYDLMGAAGFSLAAAEAFLPAAALAVAHLQTRGADLDVVSAAFGADPLAASETVGGGAVVLNDAFDMLAELVAWTAENMPNATAIGIDSAPYHLAGADEAQDLALAMATGIAYLRELTAAGRDLDAATVAKHIEFSFAIDDRFFVGIAKLRAARKLWHRILEASGIGPATAFARIHAKTAPRMFATRDPWVNMLRGTVAAFAAGVGGADSITVLPFDAALGLPDDLARRIARNTQIILQEESHLHRVIDPAGGAYAIEKLTDDLARHAWGIVQQIEAQGGMPAALANGFVADMLATTRGTREKSIATRKQPITGVSEFANLAENIPARAEPDFTGLRTRETERLAAHRQSHTGAETFVAACREKWLDANRTPGTLMAAMIEAAKRGATLGALAQAISAEPPGISVAEEHAAETEIAPLPEIRMGEAFEKLRDAADTFASRTGARPRVFLATLGSIAEHTARAGFAGNLLAAGGVDAISVGTGGETADDVAIAFGESRASVAVICSTDARYEAMAADVAAKLKSRGAVWVMLAGRGGANEAAWRAAGVDEFIFLGCDAVAVLRALHVKLGVQP